MKIAHINFHQNSIRYCEKLADDINQSREFGDEIWMEGFTDALDNVIAYHLEQIKKLRSKEKQ